MTVGFTGRVFLHGEDGYEEARVGRIFNARRADRYPAAILEARDADDLTAGVRLAAERDWTISVRSGGHSWAAWSLRDDTLLIDLGALDSIDYDPVSGVASVGPAVKGGLQLAPLLAEHGRAFPAGHCASVGLGGYLLQGGQGWNGRSRGWACESVVALDVVTASGELVRADAEQNSDLYWAARGSGPGFPALVARFHLQTYPAPPVMWQDTWTFRLEDAGPLLTWLHDVLPTLDRRVEPVVAATRLPDVPLHEGVAHPGGTVLLLHTTVMGESDDEVLSLLRPLLDGPLASRDLGHVQGPTTVLQENEAQTAQNPADHRYAVDCTWSDASADVLAPLLERMWGELDTEHSFSIWYGWAPRRELPDMAFSVEGNIYIATYAIYADESDDEHYREWVHRRTGEIADTAGLGVYLGDTDFTRRQDRFLSEEHLKRLEQIRAVRDPEGRFATYLTSDRERLNVHG